MLMIRFPNVDAVLRIYQVWHEMGYETPEEWGELIRDFYGHGEIENVAETNRSKEQVIEDLSKHLKVLVIKEDEDDK